LVIFMGEREAHTARGKVAEPMRTEAEKQKWDGKVAERTKDGWVVHGDDSTIRIKISAHPGEALSVSEKKKSGFAATVNFLDPFDHYFHCVRTNVDRTCLLTNGTISSPYEKQPREIVFDDVSNVLDSLKAKLGGDVKDLRGKVVSEKTGAIIEFGLAPKITERELTQHLTGDEVHKTKQYLLTTIEKSYNEDALWSEKITYRVEEVKRFSVPPEVRGGKMVLGGVSVESSEVRLEETIDEVDYIRRMREFYKQPGVLESMLDIFEEARTKDAELKKRVQR
jgi:hypothetical protein